jgi:hypothetical protein
VTPNPLIINGGFEGTLVPWVTNGFAELSGNAHSGNNSLVLPSGELLGQASVSQTFTDPATGTTTLSFWWESDTGCTGYNFYIAQLQDNSNGNIFAPLDACNLQSSWANVTYQLPSSMAGHSVTLYLANSSEYTGTTMTVDDVSVTNTP